MKLTKTQHGFDNPVYRFSRAAGILPLGLVSDVFRHAAAAVRSAADLRLKNRLRFQAMETKGPFTGSGAKSAQVKLTKTQHGFDNPVYRFYGALADRIVSVITVIDEERACLDQDK